MGHSMCFHPDSHYLSQSFFLFNFRLTLLEDEVGEKNDELVVFFLFYALYEIKAIIKRTPVHKKSSKQKKSHSVHLVLSNLIT